MKKMILPILVVILIAALAIGAGLYFKSKRKGIAIDSILPSQPLLYLKILDIEKGLGDFEDSLLWQNIKDIDIENLLAKSGAKETDVDLFKQKKEEVLSFISGLSLGRYFGKEFALAIYPTDVDIEGFSPLALLDLAENIILVTRVDPGVDFGSFFTNIAEQLNLVFNIRTETYKDKEISIVEINDNFYFSYTKVKDLVVAGLGKRSVNACLDVLFEERSALSKDKNYTDVIEGFSDSVDTLLYADLELFYSKLENIFAQLPASGPDVAMKKKQMDEFFRKTRGIGAVGFGSIAGGGDTSKEEAIFTIDKDKMDPAVRMWYSFKPEVNQTINFTPKDIIFYQWANYLDLGLMWEELERGMEELSQTRPDPQERLAHKRRDPSEIIEAIEKNLGLSIRDDIIPSLGNEFGGYLADIDLNSPFPIPKFLFFIEVEKRENIEGLLNRLLEGNMLPLQSEDYKGVTIKYLPLPFAMSIAPGYCFLDKYLLVSISSELLKDSLEAREERFYSLSEAPYFKAVDFGLTHRSNSVVFFNTYKFLKRIDNVLGWGFNWFSLMATNQESKLKTAEESVNSLKKKLRQEKSELKNLKLDIGVLKGEIKVLESKGSDASSRKKKLAQMKEIFNKKFEGAKALKQELGIDEERLEYLKKQTLPANISPSLVKLYLDEVVYPILNGLSVERAFGSRTEIKEDKLKSQFFSFREK